MNAQAVKAYSRLDELRNRIQKYGDGNPIESLRMKIPGIKHMIYERMRLMKNEEMSVATAERIYDYPDIKKIMKIMEAEDGKQRMGYVQSEITFGPEDAGNEQKDHGRPEKDKARKKPRN